MVPLACPQSPQTAGLADCPHRGGGFVSPPGAGVMMKRYRYAVRLGRAPACFTLPSGGLPASGGLAPPAISMPPAERRALTALLHEQTKEGRAVEEGEPLP